MSGKTVSGRFSSLWIMNVIQNGTGPTDNTEGHRAITSLVACTFSGDSEDLTFRLLLWSRSFKELHL